MAEAPFKRIQMIFAQASETPVDQRDTFLDQVCGNDAALRAEVEALLSAAGKAGEFLASPTRTSSLAISETPGQENPGSIIGPYKLLQLIGEGGFGSVFMAEQEFPIRRKVALKIIKLGMDTKQVIARFEAERQALAMMDHPNIARVFDAGTTETGRPYFVMELVRGLPITQYCDEANLSTRERVELFLDVCSAVQHAHQKGIIHRDIKPSNILVTLHGDKLVPRVIDFGVAKATEGRLTDKTLFTQFQQFIGTPAYMSPEQVSLSGLDIDTRSDIYALGVLLYELLTGRTPFDAKELLKAGLDEMRRTIRQIEPPRPSHRLSTMQGADLTITATQRHTDAPKLLHLLRGDLDWIVMKALEKDRARRYETANDLAMDIKHHLANEPITACPPSAIYRFRKMVRRNKLAFAATSAVVAALIIGLGVSTWEFGKERVARRRAVAAEQVEARLRQQAESEAAKAKAVTLFLEQALWTVNPSSGGNKGVLVRDLLDDTARKLDGGAFHDEPDVEASLRRTVGLTYVDLGSLDAARPHLERALELRRKLYGDQDVRVADSMYDLAVLGGPTAVPSLEKAMAIWQAVFGPNAPQVADTLMQLAWWDGGPADRSVTVARYRRALEIYSKAGLENTPQGIRALHYLGLSICGADPAGGIPLIREAVEKSRRFMRDKSEIADGLVDLAAVIKVAGQPAEVEALYREALEDLRDSVDFSHTDMNQAVEGLTEFLKSRGEPEKAEAVLLEQYTLLKADPRCTPQEEQWLLQRIVRLYQGWHSEKLAEWQSKLESVTDEVILRDPTSAADALEVSARSFAQHGRVVEAIAAAAKAIELKPANPSLYHGLAALLVAADEVDGYRRHCRQIVTRFAGTKDGITADRMAKACLILPNSGADPGVVSQWVETTVTSGKTSTEGLAWAQVLKALYEYRLGHFAEAAEWTQRVESAVRNPGRDAEAWLVLAMARQRLNEVGEARAALAKATEIVNTKLPTLDSGDIGTHWFDWIIVHTLMREAKPLIEGDAATTSPPGRATTTMPSESVSHP